MIKAVNGEIRLSSMDTNVVALVTIRLLSTLPRIWTFMREKRHMETDCQFIHEKLEADIICTSLVKSIITLQICLQKGFTKSYMQSITRKMGMKIPMLDLEGMC